MNSTYILIFFLILIFSFFEFVKENWIKDLVYAFLVLGLIFLGGLRYGISSDYFHYKEIFNKVVLTRDWNEFLMEYGFLSILYFFNKLGLSFEFFIFSFCSLAVLIKAFVIRKISPYPLISLLLYFTFFFLLDDMGAIRRGFACSCIFATYYFLFLNRFWIASFFILVALSMHISVLIVIPFLFFRKIKFNRNQFLIFLTLSILVGRGFEMFYNYVITFNSEFLVFQKILAYSEAQYLSEESVFEMGLFVRIFFILILFKYKLKLADVPYFEQMLNLYVIAVFILIVFSKITVFASVVIYFKIFEIVLVPLLIKSMSLKKRALLVIFFVSYAFFSLYRLTNNPISDFQTYNSIFHS